MTARLIFPKPRTFRSEAFRRAVASLPCVKCGRENLTQAAHENQGKGGAIKASDACLMALCVKCHSEIDQGGRFTKEERRVLETVLVKQTLVAMIERGLLVLA
ncbi:DUF968 domain-containing protein [Burkholderia ubonensis]|uniref:DUF968 domain-containing protein n=1 Tax=Burkholderia ubonensis TaxID=101571 RepID=UPI00075C5C3F|nr:DUF968 domain-containing protein [Burkholderia ubonensis]KVO11732.1 hypothetical protein WJ73_19480 [Burkholderia ubonensis]